MNTIRVFIAIALPQDLRNRLDDLERQLQSLAGQQARKSVRWVPASNIHLTLKFLGEIEQRGIPALARALQAAVARQPGFSFTVSGIGAFPNINQPRVLWAGVDVPQALISLERAVETETNHLGYPPEQRPFSPHLTLGRVSQTARPDELASLVHALKETQAGTLGSVTVEHVVLFRSDLQPGGPVYTPLHQFNLVN